MLDRSMRDTPSLISDLVRQTTELVSVEGRLLGAEMREAAQKAETGMVLAFVGIVLSIIGLAALAAAAVMLLIRHGLEPDAACAAVGGTAIVIGIVLALLARGRLTPSVLLPRRSLKQFSSTLKGAANDGAR